MSRSFTFDGLASFRSERYGLQMKGFMKSICLAVILSLASAIFHLDAQKTNSAPASDDPMAGLNLGDSVPLAGFPARFDHHLVTLGEDQFKSFDASTLKKVKFWAFYYSASWCPPCRAFTPTLVDFYKQFKPQHPNFELIFVNHDESQDAMLAYMKTDAMPWPAVRFDDIDRVKGNQYCGRGIPDLVLVDADGKILSDSFNGEEYLGPEKVIDDIKTMVPTP